MENEESQKSQEKTRPTSTAQGAGSNQTPQERIKYPRSVFFIVTNEFCERFTYYGMRTVLALYLKNQLDFSNDTATVIFHIFVMFCYFFPLLGAIIADSWLGKYKTILYLSAVYATGNIIVAISAIPGVAAVPFTAIGLILIASGTGGIKPCVAAFGGDQFVLPQQETHLKKFFSIFYFTINAGSFVSTLLTPVLREVECLGMETCYSLAFGVPALLMITAIVIFVSGTKFYKIKKPEGNVVVKVLKCISYAIKKRRQGTGHWLDKAGDKYDQVFINDVKAALRVLVLYIPLPFFWALFDQQGSRWTFQASRMDGDIGSVEIQPDQMQVVNPVLILAFIPLFETALYPLLAKCNLLKKPLQRLTAGGLLAALSFVVSAIVEYKLEETYAVLPKPDEGQLRVYNGLPEVLNLQFDDPHYDPESIPVMGYWRKYDVPAKGEAQVKVRYTVNGAEKTDSLTVVENALTSYIIFPERKVQIPKDDPDKSKVGHPKLMIIYAEPTKPTTVILKGCSRNQEFSVTNAKPYSDYEEVPECDAYRLFADGILILNDFKLKQGGVYVVVALASGGTSKGNLLNVVQPNSVHMLWLVPQYVIITAGEIMFSITGLEFSFTQAPVSMKALLQAAWLLTVAAGNLIVVIIAQSRVFERQLYEFLLFAALMTLDMIAFILMAMRYKYVQITDEGVKPVEPGGGGPTQKRTNTFPKAVIFIICNELCERFAFYSASAILGQYLKTQLNLPITKATLIHRTFVMSCYFFPLLGGIMADTWLGKYKTILYLSAVYVTGDGVIAVAAIPGVPKVIISIIALILIATGTGFIKPCVIAFGGDQFADRGEESHISKYFSIFYFTINVGSFIAHIVAPLLSHMHCLGTNSCYSLAFGVTALTMLVALGVFVGGTKFYKRKKPEGNKILKVIKCILYALRRHKRRSEGHWLDRASDKYNQQFIDEVKHILRLLVLYIPLPFFWALFDQQGSRWAFQASRMNGDIGNMKLYPEQVETLNPILILVFIPLFEAFVYPTFARYNLLKKPLQRLTVGGLLAALAFVASALVEYKLEETYAILPKPKEGQIRVYNGLPEILNIEFVNPPYGEESIALLDFWRKYDVPATGEAHLNIKYIVKGEEKTDKLTVVENALTSYIVMPDKIVQIPNDDPTRSVEGNPKVMVIYSEPNKPTMVAVMGCNHRSEFYVTKVQPYTEYDEVTDCDSVSISVDGKLLQNETKMKQGADYVILILGGRGNDTLGSVLTVVPPNSVHMLWLVPQYVLITAGEVMFSITGLEFSFTQAPSSMKASLQAVWLLTVAVGNVLVAITAQTKIFERQLYEFWLFAGLMGFDMFIFALISLRYKYVVYSELEDVAEGEDMEKKALDKDK